MTEACVQAGNRHPISIFSEFCFKGGVIEIAKLYFQSPVPAGLIMSTNTRVYCHFAALKNWQISTLVSYICL